MRQNEMTAVDDARRENREPMPVRGIEQTFFVLKTTQVRRMKGGGE